MFDFAEDENSLDAVVSRSAAALMARQQADGHWVFPLEADATIPAEYVLYLHYLDERDPALEEKIGVYLRSIQEEHGGWPLFPGGDLNVSASVKAYFALKALGDDIAAPHMRRAREAILAHGGAAASNVFTRTLLALFGQVPWRAVPVMPVEIMLLPKWFPFHLDKVSYWSRTVIVPLLVLMALKPQARNPLGVHVRELFQVAPEEVRDWHTEPARSRWAYFFRRLDGVLQVVDPWFPKAGRRKAIARARAWVDERLNGEEGLGAIFPAMVNAVLMHDVLGTDPSDPRVVTAKRALRKLVVDEGDRAWVQPCVSPVWDTALACHALLEAGDEASMAAARRGADWLVERQITDVVGDWALQRPDLAPGGWAFQYANPHYPDVDDTAVVMAALDRLDGERYGQVVASGATWIRGMQSEGGGWGAFDAENTHYALNHIPFADHGALLDPPTADVSARCVSALSMLGERREDPVVKQGVDYLLAEQEADGSWFGRWGTNYIYGTWSALAGLNAAGVAHDHPAVRKAVAWLVSKQREDGGWGEDGRSYWDEQPRGDGPVSTASQTAWALLGLMAVGETDSEAVARGVAYLLESRNDEGLWDEEHFTAVGFPRVFYLRYHGYRTFFPVWALARYRNLTSGNAGPVLHAL
ncbi:squalene--hopene cyclase [Telmatospirillum siberiense]|uniref:Squalene--hopene cyclase n=1 Tax=Telmatospirillum siberiense TaxID=382514 RepID=A0A2N3PX52_9PROT|nr:squalene--hopene cyclase [Telmatospirillum siberiense]PKU24993.1 squalene--hopene cyclase [Telmatospirillum siberiense]